MIDMYVSDERLDELIAMIKRGDRLAFYSSKEWKKLRAIARERDNNECQGCREEGRVFTAADATTRKKLEVDHVIEIKDDPSLCLTLSNLRTLCLDCHNKKHMRYRYAVPKWNDERW